MKPGTRRYTVETIRAGQPRPYADSIYEFILTVELIPYANPQGEVFEPNPTLAEHLVLRSAKGVCMAFKTKDESPGWADATLSSFTREPEKHKWRIVVTSAYTD